MSFLFDPNVAYLLLVLGFLLSILALFTPGTGILEIGALFTIALAGYAIYHLTINWWALLLLIAAAVPFVFALRKAKKWYWMLPALALFIGGSLFLFPQSPTSQTLNPVFAIFMSIICLGLLWLIGRRGIDAMRMKPSQDLKRLIDQIGEARTDIKNYGTVYVNSEEWTARSNTPIEAGNQVKVVGREGLVLLVEPVEKNE